MLLHVSGPTQSTIPSEGYVCMVPFYKDASGRSVYIADGTLGL